MPGRAAAPEEEKDVKTAIGAARAKAARKPREESPRQHSSGRVSPRAIVGDMRRDPSRRRVFWPFWARSCWRGHGGGRCRRAGDRDLAIAEGATSPWYSDSRAGAGCAWNVDGMDAETVALIEPLGGARG